MRNIKSSIHTVLEGPVAVVLKSKDECIGDPQLADFVCSDGPAATEVQMIVANLLSGEALPQTVALLKDELGGNLLGLCSIRMDGNVQIRSKSSTPWFLRRISVNPYINLLARDERFRGHVLADGRTQLGVALLRAGLEVVGQGWEGGQLPSVWALVKRENEASKRAFAQFAFHRHDRSQENPQDVFVRRAGKPLPPALPAGIYRPEALPWSLRA